MSSGLSFTCNISGLQKMIGLVSDPTVKRAIENISRNKGVAALVSQAISENFQKRGPGWPPLKAETVLKSVNAKARKRLEKARGKTGTMGGIRAYHKALDAARSPLMGRTRLLFKSATTPGAPGNIYRVDGSKLIWGTHLIYARIHNKGGLIKNGFGRGVRIRIPKREYLKLTDYWKNELNVFALEEATRILGDYVRKRA